MLEVKIKVFCNSFGTRIQNPGGSSSPRSQSTVQYSAMLTVVQYRALESSAQWGKEGSSEICYHQLFLFHLTLPRMSL